MVSQAFKPVRPSAIKMLLFLGGKGGISIRYAIKIPFSKNDSNYQIHRFNIEADFSLRRIRTIITPTYLGG